MSLSGSTESCGRVGGQNAGPFTHIPPLYDRSPQRRLSRPLCADTVEKVRRAAVVTGSLSVKLYVATFDNDMTALEFDKSPILAK